ncbi:hypothetical protein BIY29_17995 [Brenneria alni]|uniref:Nickel/cobalt homeostasis protein RcnB n=1 Tax=Brenneria alni TaxID=71656 RepID=A0A421DJC7_9GAMM|nr:RcnB family protein [Brenneria alni]RLM18623.1 hypothetical protein BIY29_17995 [Brenneria alni]
MTKKTLALTMSLLLVTSSFSPITFAERPNGPQEHKYNQNSGERRKAPDARGNQRNVSNNNRHNDRRKNEVRQTSRERRNTGNFRERDHFVWGGNDFRRGHPVPQRYRGDGYRVNDWRMRGLRQPPAGHHWAYVNGNYVLIAAATGIITAILLNSALN